MAFPRFLRAPLLRAAGVLTGASLMWIGFERISITGVVLMLLGLIAIVVALATPRAPSPSLRS